MSPNIMSSIVKQCPRSSFHLRGDEDSQRVWHTSMSPLLHHQNQGSPRQNSRWKKSRRILRELGFIPVPVQISFPWCHPNNSRRKRDCPFPLKRFLWKSWFPAPTQTIFPWKCVRPWFSVPLPRNPAEIRGSDFPNPVHTKTVHKMIKW